MAASTLNDVNTLIQQQLQQLVIDSSKLIRNGSYRKGFLILDQQILKCLTVATTTRIRLQLIRRNLTCIVKILSSYVGAEDFKSNTDLLFSRTQHLLLYYYLAIQRGQAKGTIDIIDQSNLRPNTFDLGEEGHTLPELRFYIIDLLTTIIRLVNLKASLTKNHSDSRIVMTYFTLQASIFEKFSLTHYQVLRQKSLFFLLKGNLAFSLLEFAHADQYYQKSFEYSQEVIESILVKDVDLQGKNHLSVFSAQARVLILTLVLIGSIEEQRNNFLKALESIKLASWIETKFLKNQIELRVLLHTSLSGLQDRYGHYIQEQRDIESVLKRVVQVVVPVIEEPAKLELRDDFEKTNETLYARFKVDELNRSLYLYHGPLQQQTSPPMSHRRTITTVTGKKASVLEAESVEETTAMITPNQQISILSQRIDQHRQVKLQMMSLATHSEPSTQISFRMKTCSSLRPRMPPERNSKSASSNQLSRLCLQEHRLDRVEKALSPMIMTRCIEFEILKYCREKRGKSSFFSSKKTDVYQNLISIKPKPSMIPDLDGFLSSQILQNLRKEDGFTTFEAMKQQVKVQEEINKLSQSDFLMGNKILRFQHTYGNQLIKRTGPEPNNKTKASADIRIRSQHFFEVNEAQKRVKEGRQKNQDLYSQLEQDLKGMDAKRGDEYKFRKMFKKILLGQSKSLGFKNLGLNVKQMMKSNVQKINAQEEQGEKNEEAIEQKIRSRNAEVLKMLMDEYEQDIQKQSQKKRSVHLKTNSQAEGKKATQSQDKSTQACDINLLFLCRISSHLRSYFQDLSKTTEFVSLQSETQRKITSFSELLNIKYRLQLSEKNSEAKESKFKKRLSSLNLPLKMLTSLAQK